MRGPRGRDMEIFQHFHHTSITILKTTRTPATNKLDPKCTMNSERRRNHHNQRDVMKMVFHRYTTGTAYPRGTGIFLVATSFPCRERPPSLARTRSSRVTLVLVYTPSFDSTSRSRKYLCEACSQVPSIVAAGLDRIQDRQLFLGKGVIGRESERAVHGLVGQVQVEGLLIERSLLLEDLERSRGRDTYMVHFCVAGDTGLKEDFPPPC